MEIIDLLDHLRHFVNNKTSQGHVIKQTTLIWRKEQQKTYEIWALANFCKIMKPDTNKNGH